MRNAGSLPLPVPCTTCLGTEGWGSSLLGHRCPEWMRGRGLSWVDRRAGVATQVPQILNVLASCSRFSNRFHKLGLFHWEVGLQSSSQCYPRRALPSTIAMFILQMRHMRHREVKWLAWGCTVDGKAGLQNCVVWLLSLHWAERKFLQEMAHPCLQTEERVRSNSWEL